MELIGTIQFRMNGLRGSPVSIFMEQTLGEVLITIRLPQWKHIVGVGATVNKAAANFETNLKAALPSEEAYDGPYWNGGIKPEKPVPPKPVAPATAATLAQPPSEGAASPPAPPPAPSDESGAVTS